MDSSVNRNSSDQATNTPDTESRADGTSAMRSGNSLAVWWRVFVDELRGRRQFARYKVLVDRYQMAPEGVELKIIGQMWIDRRPAYWLRRGAWSIVWLWFAFFGVGLSVTATVELFTASLPLVFSIIIVAVWWLSAIPAFVFPWRRLAVFPFGEKPASPFIYPGPLLAPLFVLFLPVLAGMCSAIFLSTLRKNFPGEAAAREAYVASRSRARSRGRSTRKRK